MKNHHFHLLLPLLTLLAPACRQVHSPAPLEFSAYAGNPVLSPGEPGSWDELFLWSPQVVLDKSEFYLFYLGGNVSGRMAIGLAFSHDGYHFEKFQENPILFPDGQGFDAFTVGPGIVLKTDSLWLMYYNAQDLMAFAPGHFAGRATAISPAGPWKRSESPILSSGSTGEWDAGFVVPSSVLLLEDETYMMFFSGGIDMSLWDFYVGMATSPDGIIWTKYNDPKTTQHPFAESDPILFPGKEGEWDGAFVWMANVTKFPEGYRMYYAASALHAREELKAIGYATSPDGIDWEKYSGNPIYRSEDDPFIISQGKIGYMENPELLYLDSACMMYYECGPFQVEKSYICVAKGVGIE